MKLKERIIFFACLDVENVTNNGLYKRLSMQSQNMERTAASIYFSLIMDTAIFIATEV